MPFKSGDSLSAGEQSVSASASDAAPSERAEGSIASVGNLFGSPGSGCLCSLDIYQTSVMRMLRNSCQNMMTLGPWTPQFRNSSLTIFLDMRF